MVNLDVLAPGVKVKIVDEWEAGCGQNVDGLMDKYLIEEDSGDCRFRVGGHWAWNSYCFDYIVDSNEPDFEPSSESEILSFIFKE